MNRKEKLMEVLKEYGLNETQINYFVSNAERVSEISELEFLKGTNMDFCIIDGHIKTYIYENDSFSYYIRLDINEKKIIMSKIKKTNLEPPIIIQSATISDSFIESLRDGTKKLMQEFIDKMASALFQGNTDIKVNDISNDVEQQKYENIV